MPNKLEGVTLEGILCYMEGCLDNYDVSTDEIRVSYDKFDMIYEFLKTQARIIKEQKESYELSTSNKICTYLRRVKYDLNDEIDSLMKELQK